MLQPNLFSFPFKKRSFKLILILSLFLSTAVSQAQEFKEVNNKTYTIVEKGAVSDIQPYIDAMNNSDMKNHRLLNSRYTITFEKGLKVELFSATEVSRNGFQLVLSEYPEEFSSSRQEPIFALGANNFVLEYHTARTKH